MKLQNNMQKTKIVAAVLLIIVALGFIAYNFYPTISQSFQKNKIVAVAKEDNTSTPDRIDFASLLAMNPQTVGWVQIDGTPIEYPVVQTDNNDYYLNHNFSMQESFVGSIFLDYLCKTELTRNNVLYGHYMADESMFGSLWGYQDVAYFKQHPIIKYDRPGDPGDWEIFTAYVTESDYDYRQPDFHTDTEFFAYMTRLKARSIYDTGVVLKPDDEVITLSTCIYTFDDARFTISARRIK